MEEKIFVTLEQYNYFKERCAEILARLEVKDLLNRVSGKDYVIYVIGKNDGYRMIRNDVSLSIPGWIKSTEQRILE